MSRSMFMSFATVGLLLGWSGICRAEDDCKAILAKAIQAHGGEEKLAKIHAIKTKIEGELTIKVNNDDQQAPVSGDVSILFPDKLKCNVTIEVMGQTVQASIVCNKDKGSVQAPGQDKDLEEAELRDVKELIHLLHISTRLVTLKDKAYTLTPLAEEKKVKKPLVGFKVKSKDYHDLDLFFDKASGMLAKVRYQKEDENGKKKTSEMLIKEYEKVDGISVPKKIGLEYGGKEVEVNCSETKLPAKIDEKEFDKPSSK